MLYREIIAVSSEIHTKHINTVCGQNVKVFYVKTGCTYSSFKCLTFLKPTGNFTRHKVYCYHTEFVCFIRISEQRAYFALQDIKRLVFYNRGGECLLRGTQVPVRV
jgi:hypothetical protein